MLRDLWFPLLIAFFGVLFSVPGFYAEDNLGRVLKSIAVLIFALAILTYIWGDPVHGPFYKLIKPNASDEFKIHGGVTAIFSNKDLASGIDFSRVISMQNNPIKLFVKKTWWSGVEYKVSILDNTGKTILSFDNKQLDEQNLPQDWDVNYDENAFELVDENKVPRLQIVQSTDSDLYVNFVLNSSNNLFTIQKGNMLLINVTQSEAEKNELDRIFKYPSYINQSIRI